MKTNTWITGEDNKLSKQLIIQDEYDNGVVIKVTRAAICGTDLHVLEGHDSVKRPLSLGHEFIGVIEEITGNRMIYDKNGIEFKTGDRVIIAPGISCGECIYCSEYKQPNWCINRKSHGLSTLNPEKLIIGGFSERVPLITGIDIYKIPDQLTDDLAILAEPLTVALRAFERATSGLRTKEKNTVVVLGLGPIGVLISLLALYKGCELIGVEPIEYRREYVRTFGINAVDSITESTVIKNDLNDGFGADIVFECAGNPEAVEKGIQLLRRGGRLVVVGHFFKNGTFKLDPWDICRNELEIVGSVLGNENEYDRAIELLMDKKIPWDKVISHLIQFEEADNAFLIAKNRNSMKVVLVNN